MSSLSTHDLHSEDSPFQLFLRNINGLRSYQPTLLWKIEFDRYKTEDNNYPKQIVIFTDSITVPGEKIATSTAETFIGDIPYPINERRNTTNMLSIGFFVDIYGTLEKRIVDDMKQIAQHGIKIGDKVKQQINLYGYRMGTNDYNKYKYNQEFTRPCYIHYQFEKCLPVTMDEYTYDHKNDRWGRTRNVTFSFVDYKIEVAATVLKDEDEKYEENKEFSYGIDFPLRHMLPDAETIMINTQERKAKNGDIIWKGINPAKDDRLLYANWEDAELLGTTDLSKGFKVKVDEEDSRPRNLIKQTIEQIFTQTIEGSDKEKGQLKTVVRPKPEDNILSNVDTPRWSSSNQTDNLLENTDDVKDRLVSQKGEVAYKVETANKARKDRVNLSFAIGAIHNAGKSGNGVKMYYQEKSAQDLPEGARSSVSYTTSYETNSLSRKVTDGGAIYTFRRPNDYGSDAIDPSNPTYGPYRRESLITSIVKTAVKKYLVPDTPQYNGALAPVAKAIRKVQQWFYTEPKHKDIPYDDHIINHGPADTIHINQDDTPYQNNLGRPSLVPIDPNDYTKQNTHGDPNVVPIDPNDHTEQNTHGDPNNVPVDPNDHTTHGNHGSPNNVQIDPNDYTKQNEHGDPNNVPVDPNDHTTHDNHGSPNNIPIDPNDYTTHGSHGNANTIPIDPNDYTMHDGHGDVDLVPVDPDDHLIQTTAVGHQISIEQNDYAKSANLSPNLVPIDPNDHIVDASTLNVNKKLIDPNDYAVGANVDSNVVPVNPNDYAVGADIAAKTVPVNPNDYVVRTEVKPDLVKVPQNDHVADAATLDYKNVKIEENDHALGEDVLKGKAKLVASPQNDMTNIFTHEKADLVSVDQNDAVKDHRRPDNIVPVGQNDSIQKHRQKGKLVSVDQDDTPVASEVREKRVPVERSFIDFAKIIVNEKKSGGDHITSHDPVKEITRVDDDKLTSHSGLSTKLVDLPDEPQSIRSTKNRNTGHLVDVHQDDHTELDKYERK